jgi:hypothetical protein
VVEHVFDGVEAEASEVLGALRPDGTQHACGLRERRETGVDRPVARAVVPPRAFDGRRRDGLAEDGEQRMRAAQQRLAQAALQLVEDLLELGERRRQARRTVRARPSQPLREHGQRQTRLLQAAEIVGGEVLEGRREGLEQLGERRRRGGHARR